MTIWILALLLFVLLGIVGYNQGAIRVAFSLLGLVVASMLAMPLGPVVKPAITACGIKNPALIWMIGPLAVFILVMILFKGAGLAVHRAVDVFYKYKAGDLRLALWERLNHRVGAALGMLNAAVYLLLISLVIYVLGYWTTQMATADTDPKAVRYCNRFSKDLQSTGVIKAVRAIDPMPEAYYDAGDIVGLVYHNPLLQSRLSRYPSVLGLAERPEFQDLANDKEFLEMLQRQVPIAEVINHPKTQVLLNNSVMLQQVWILLGGDLKDLRSYLETGKSAKYDGEKILGRWNFEVSSALALLKKSKPNMTSGELQRLRKAMLLSYAKTTFVATPDNLAFLKGVVKIRIGANNQPILDEPHTRAGTWKSDGNNYLLTLPESKGDLTAVVDGDRMTITGDALPMVFRRED